MATVRRANVVLHIKDTEVDRYIDLGYVQTDDRGNVIRAGVPTDLGQLKKAYVDHMNEIAQLKAEINSLKAELTEAKAKKSRKTETE